MPLIEISGDNRGNRKGAIWEKEMFPEHVQNTGLQILEA